MTPSQDRAREVAREHDAKEKSQIAAAVGLAIYARMYGLAQINNQLVGEKNDLYVTLEQLERAFCDLRDELGIAQQ